MTKTTYKVGDKVRILGTENILLGEEIKIVGGYAEVESVSNEGYPRLACRDGAPLIITKSELQYIEKVEESDAKMTQFKVGDKVRVINANASKHSNGDEGVVVSITPIWDVVFYDVDVNGMQQGHYDKDIELVSQKPTKNQRISTLEQKIEAMQAEIDAIKAAQKAPVTTIADAVKPTPNEQASANEKRKAIIDEAKAFVEKYSGIVKVDTTPYTTMAGDTTVKLFVNKEKRIVTAIPHLANVNYTDHNDKKFAKCAPDDVFNEHIGKAIALGRALGLDVERYEKAVQPSEVVVGMKINDESVIQTVSELIDTPYETLISGKKVSGQAFNTKESYGWLAQSQVTIADDTEAQY